MQPCVETQTDRLKRFIGFFGFKINIDVVYIIRQIVLRLHFSNKQQRDRDIMYF